MITLLVVLHVACAAAAAVHLLLRYRTQASAVAWLFAISLLPLAGPLLYAMLAVPNGDGRALRRRRHAEGLRRTDERGRGHDRADAVVDDELRIARSRLPQPFELRSANDVELVAGDGEALRRQLAAIANARREVLLSTYVLKDGSVQRALVDALADRVAAGVTVRVLIDPIGSHELDRETFEAIRERGVDVRTFLSPNPLKGRLQVNFRNHRKILCIDGAEAFTGGRNWSNEYYRDGGDDEPFRDTTVRVTGPVVVDMRRVFLEDWALATGDHDVLTQPFEPANVEPPAGDGVPMRVQPFGPDEPRSSVMDTFGCAFRAARDSIFVATPYFAPGPTLYHGLRFAALEGVRVDLLLPRRCGKRSIDLTARSYFQGLLDAGVNVHLREAPLMHAKAVIVDGRWSSVGSVNFDARSVHLNYELNLEVCDERFAQRMRRYFEADLQRSQAVDADRFRRRGRVSRMKERVARLFEPLM